MPLLRATLSEKPSRAWMIALGLLFALYLALGATGFGTDGDTYTMIRSGMDVWRHGVYAPSRAPGYPLPELVLGAVTLLGQAMAFDGGSVLAANGVSAILACIALACFHQLLRDAFGERFALLAMLAAGLNPHWILAASSSMDYLYGAAFFLAGCLALRGARVWTAAVLFTLCVASRVTYLPAVWGAFLAFGLMQPSASVPGSVLGSVPGSVPRIRWIAAVGAFTVMSLAAYAPGWLVSGGQLLHVNATTHDVSFFSWSGLGSPAAYAGRFVYKNVFLWGIAGFGLVALAKLALLLQVGRLERTRRQVLGVIAGAIAYFELLFLRLPLEIAYLIPVVFLVVTAIGFLPKAGRWLIVLCLAQGVQGLVSFDLIEVRYASRSHLRVEASSARFAPGIHRGPVWKDLADREEARLFYFGLHLPELREEDFRPLY